VQASILGLSAIVGIWSYRLFIGRPIMQGQQYEVDRWSLVQAFTGGARDRTE
jgi:hypothetical protein